MRFDDGCSFLLWREPSYDDELLRQTRLTDANIVSDAADIDICNTTRAEMGLHVRMAELLVVVEGGIGVDVRVDAFVHCKRLGMNLVQIDMEQHVF